MVSKHGKTLPLQKYPVRAFLDELRVALWFQTVLCLIISTWHLCSQALKHSEIIGRSVLFLSPIREVLSAWRLLGINIKLPVPLKDEIKLHALQETCSDIGQGLLMKQAQWNTWSEHDDLPIQHGFGLSTYTDRHGHFLSFDDRLVAHCYLLET